MGLRNVLYMILFFLFSLSCSKEGVERMDDFLLDFATVNKSSGKTYFILDNYRVLVPTIEPTQSWNEGQRVGINYTLLNGDTIKINSVSEIYTGQLKYIDEEEEIEDDPIKIESVWVGGSHLNIIFYAEYYNTPHTIDLFYNLDDNSEAKLYLSYSRNGDSPGYSKKMYASFNLADIQSESEDSTPFKLSINTFAGLRVYEFAVSGKRR